MKSKFIRGFTHTPILASLQLFFKKIVKKTNFSKRGVYDRNVTLQQKTRPKLVSGFTLNELLVVIAIIGILASVVTAGLSSMKQKSKDAKRIALLKNLEQAVELYFQEHSKFPSRSQLIDSGYFGADGITAIQEEEVEGGIRFLIYEYNTDGKSYCLGVNTKIVTNSENCSLGNIASPEKYTYRIAGP